MSNGISFRHKGSFNNIEKFLNKVLDRKYLNVLNKYGERGVQALAAATPKDTGATAAGWNFIIEQTADGVVSLIFTNSHNVKGANIAILLQYGHGTGNGGYVRGRDYINPAIRPVFDTIAEEAWREVTSL